MKIFHCYCVAALAYLRDSDPAPFTAFVKQPAHWPVSFLGAVNTDSRPETVSLCLLLNAIWPTLGGNIRATLGTKRCKRNQAVKVDDQPELPQLRIYRFFAKLFWLAEEGWVSGGRVGVEGVRLGAESMEAHVPAVPVLLLSLELCDNGAGCERGREVNESQRWWRQRVISESPQNLWLQNRRHCWIMLYQVSFLEAWRRYSTHSETHTMSAVYKTKFNTQNHFLVLFVCHVHIQN